MLAELAMWLEDPKVQQELAMRADDPEVYEDEPPGLQAAAAAVRWRAQEPPQGAKRHLRR